jgi:hypothetical protein
MTRMRGKIIGFLILSAFLLGNAGIAMASIELRYVNARQAYFDTFFNKTVAQLIFEESTAHNINPRLILTILQRESSSITQTTPSSTTRAAWPLFYNYDERMADCLNGVEASCNDIKYNKADYSYRAENYGGVGQQIAYATAQLRNLAGDSNPNNGTYCDSSLVVSVDGQNITADNAGTCALYKYTPHTVSYNTASAFYTRWHEWWEDYPNEEGFVATNIIKAEHFDNTDPLTAQQINDFLIAQGSWLANYVIPEYISVAYPGVYIPPAPSRKAGDASGDNAVDSTDLSILADQWGKSVAANTGADFNGDGVVDSTDLSILADAWGK